jgi:hypothetical protein
MEEVPTPALSRSLSRSVFSARLIVSLKSSAGMKINVRDEAGGLVGCVLGVHHAFAAG